MAHAVAAKSQVQPGARTARPPLGQILLVMAAVLVCLGVGAPLVLTIVMSIRPGLLTQPSVLSLDSYRQAWSTASSLTSLGNTFAFAFGTTVVALLFGVPLAFLQRTDFPHRSWLFPIMTVQLVIPIYITSMAWILLLSPRIGLINQAVMRPLGLTDAPLSIYSLGGMSLIQGLSLASLAFFMLTAVFSALDSTLEEAAQASGVGRVKTLLHIDLPLIVPGLLGATVYIFMIGMGSFEVPALIGLPQRIYLLSTEIYSVTHPDVGLPDYGLGAAFGVALLVAGLLLMWWYWRLMGGARQYAVVTGHGYRRTVVRLGEWRPFAHALFWLYVALELLLPLLALLWISVSPFVRPVSLDALQGLTLEGYASLFAGIGLQPLVNTIILMLVVPICTLLLGFAVSWISTRTRFRGRAALDTVAFLPHAVSSTLMAVAFSYLFLSIARVFPIYGSIWSLILVLTVLHLPFTTRAINGALLQIHAELEEVGRVSGIRQRQILRRVFVPLIAPVLLSSLMWLGLMAYRDVTVPVMLSSPQNEVISSTIWRLWRSADYAHASALGVVVLAAALVLLVVARKAIARAVPAGF